MSCRFFHLIVNPIVHFHQLFVGDFYVYIDLQF